METVDPIHTRVGALLNETAMPYTLQGGVFEVDQIRGCIRFTTRITPDFFNGRIQTLIINTSVPLVQVETEGDGTNASGQDPTSP